MRYIIIFCGNIGCGKDTAASYFINKYGFTSSKMAGSLDRVGSLKRVVWEIFDLDFDKLEDRTYRESPNANLGGKTPRQALQYFGHETRQFLQEVWVNNTIRHIRTLGNDNFVISDIRYKNECDIIRNMQSINTKVVLVAIKNPNLDLSLPVYQDPSETEIPEIQKHADFTITNDGTLEQFYAKLDAMFQFVTNTYIEG